MSKNGDLIPTPLDPALLASLETADVSNDALVRWSVLLQVDDGGRPIASGAPAMIRDGRVEGTAGIRLVGSDPLTSLFRSGRVVEDFGSRPPAEYDLVFAFLERALSMFVSSLPRPMRDDDFLRLFSEMRRRPDKRFESPLYQFFQNVLRALLKLRPTSESEFDALLRRLERSARTFRVDAASMNYWENVLAELP